MPRDLAPSAVIGDAGGLALAVPSATRSVGVARGQGRVLQHRHPRVLFFLDVVPMTEAPEDWRLLIQRSADVLTRDVSTFRRAIRYGLVEIKAPAVEFFFERAAKGEPS